MFTYRSFVLYVNILRLSFILSVEMLCAKFSEFCVLYWFSSCRRCFKILFSFFCYFVCGCIPVVDYRSDWVVWFVYL